MGGHVGNWSLRPGEFLTIGIRTTVKIVGKDLGQMVAIHQNENMGWNGHIYIGV